MSGLRDVLREFDFLEQQRVQGVLDGAGTARWQELKAYLDANFPEGIPPPGTYVEPGGPASASAFSGDIPGSPFGPADDDDDVPFVDDDALMSLDEVEAPDAEAPSAEAAAGGMDQPSAADLLAGADDLDAALDAGFASSFGPSATEAAPFAPAPEPPVEAAPFAPVPPAPVPEPPIEAAPSRPSRRRLCPSRP